jgi:alkylation response protein AidB-like acyl-CoA dehydrogenase
MLDWAALALSAEALGAMETTFAMLTDYLGTRTQFGKPIGTFQALQHRTVDLSIEIEQARSIVIAAAQPWARRRNHKKQARPST